MGAQISDGFLNQRSLSIDREEFEEAGPSGPTLFDIPPAA
jgi:hypothetical protein